MDNSFVVASLSKSAAARGMLYGSYLLASGDSQGYTFFVSPLLPYPLFIPSSIHRSASSLSILLLFYTYHKPEY